jgi:hypothetical protein
MGKDDPSTAVVWRFLCRQLEHVFPTALRANRLHPALDVPVAVPDFDVDPTRAVVGRQEHRRILAVAEPPAHGRFSLRPARHLFGRRSSHTHPLSGIRTSVLVQFYRDAPGMSMRIATHERMN